MTEQQAAGAVPEITLGWRLKMALAHADTGVQEMADYLEVSRETLRRWTSDQAPPKRHVLIAWAVRTGVDLGWLETGKAPATDGGEGLEAREEVAIVAQLPRLDSNQQPSG